MKVIKISVIALAGAALLSACGDGGADTAAGNANIGNANANVTNSEVISNANLANASKELANALGDSAKTPLSEADKKFLTEAARSSAAEVLYGGMAAAKSTNQQLKEFGQMILEEHNTLTSEIGSVAARKGFQVPLRPDAVNDPKAKELQMKTGAEFDRAYLETVIAAHEGDIPAFEAAANGADNADVKALAAKSLPTLQKHLETLRAIRSGMN